MTANPLPGTWGIVPMEEWNQNQVAMKVPAYIAVKQK